MVVVEAHYYFGVAVVEGDGLDFDQDFVFFGDGKGSGGSGEVFKAVLGGYPLLD